MKISFFVSRFARYLKASARLSPCALRLANILLPLLLGIYSIQNLALAQTPELPGIDKQKYLSSAVSITLKAFEITGCTVFSRDQLTTKLQPYFGRELNSEDLEDIRLDLTRMYIDAGYINSGIVIPDQDVSSGILRLRAIEGALGEVRILGAVHLRPSFIERRLRLGAGQPLNVPRLQQRMQRLLAESTISQINAELQPAEQPGVGILQVAVDEGKRYTLDAELANSRNPNVGEFRFAVTGGVRNLLGWNDQWSLRLGKVEGADDFALSTTHPISANDTTLKLLYEKSDSLIVEEPFDVIDIRGRSKTFEISLRYPLQVMPLHEFAIGASLARRAHQTWLGGEAFDFSAGSHDGKSVAVAIRLTADWLSRSSVQVNSTRITLSQGIDAFGATINPGGVADSRFTSLNGQWQVLRVVPDRRGEVSARAGFQVTTAALLPQEKFGLGGKDSVRGFRENTQVRDNGWFASIEYRIPFDQDNVQPARSRAGGWQGLLFADGGSAWEDGDSMHDPLWSAGPGLRWQSGETTRLGLYWAALRKKVERGDSLQDRGVHLKVELRHAF